MESPAFNGGPVTTYDKVGTGSGSDRLNTQHCQSRLLTLYPVAVV